MDALQRAEPAFTAGHPNGCRCLGCRFAEARTVRGRRDLLPDSILPKRAASAAPAAVTAEPDEQEAP